jgi:hypothetical protein
VLKLRLLTGPRAGRQLRVSDTKPVSVGRRVGRLRLHDSRVSKRHAKIFFAGGVWVLRDLGSANGTFVNRRKCDGLIELETGDVVQMGRVLIKILQADAVGMDPTRTAPSTRGTQASGLGIDAFTASGATGALPAIDPADLEEDNTPDAAGDVDLASIFGDDSDDDLIDFSDQSRADASQAGTIAAGQTAASQETIGLEPIELDDDVPTQTADHHADAGGDQPADDDALLAGVDPQNDDGAHGDDLIDIDDDPHPPTKLGTTMLAAIDRDDAQCESADDDRPAVVGLRLDQAAPQQPAGVETDDAQTPEPTLDGSAEDAVDEVRAADVDVQIGDDAQAVSEPSETAPAPPAPFQAERAADASLTESPADDDEADEMLDLETAHAELAFDDIAEAGPIPVDPDALAEELWPLDEPQVVADPAQAEVSDPAPPLQPQGGADLEARVAHEADAGVDLDAQATTEPETNADQATDDDAQSPSREPDSALATDAEQPPDEPTPADPKASEEDANQPPTGLATPAGFDIDAAFDALSEGLDDSLSMPALTDETEQADETAAEGQADGELALDPVDSSFAFEPDTESEERGDASTADALADAQAQPPEGPPADEAVAAEETHDAEAVDDAAYAGSQLDIGFIREALAQLEADAPADADADAGQPAAEQRGDTPAPAETQARSQADEPGVGTLGADQTSDDETSVALPLDGAPIAQPILAPPGLNPTSVLPPIEPDRSYRPAGEKRKFRWLFTALSMFVVFVLGVVFTFIIITQGRPIAGRPDAGADQSPNANDDAAVPGADTADQPQTRGDTDTAPPDREQLPDNPYTDPPFDDADPLAPLALPGTIAGAAPVPEPFAQGPSVLGASAVAGITVPNNADPADLPRTDPDPRPGVVIEPDLPGTDPPTNPPRPRDPQDQPDTEAGPDPTPDVASPDPATDITPPALPDPPASRIVFLVDASGSLVDSLPQMLVWLGEAVNTVGDDERFAVIFFKADKAIETAPAGLQKPTRDVLNKLEQNWLDPAAAPLLPTGRSDPSVAIAKALSYKPTDLYLLSDESFARFAGDTTRDQAVKLVNNAIGDTDVKLHGVQFFYRDEGGVLETLANQHGGTFEFVKEDVVPEGDPIDLLEELDKEGE